MLVRRATLLHPMATRVSTCIAAADVFSFPRTAVLARREEAMVDQASRQGTAAAIGAIAAHATQCAGMAPEVALPVAMAASSAAAYSTGRNLAAYYGGAPMVARAVGAAAATATAGLQAYCMYKFGDADLPGRLLAVAAYCGVRDAVQEHLKPHSSIISVPHAEGLPRHVAVNTALYAPVATATQINRRMLAPGQSSGLEGLQVAAGTGLGEALDGAVGEYLKSRHPDAEFRRSGGQATYQSWESNASARMGYLDKIPLLMSAMGGADIMTMVAGAALVVTASETRGEVVRRAITGAAK